MKQIHKDRLLKLADFLDTVPYEHFDLSVVTGDNTDLSDYDSNMIQKKLCKLSKNIKQKGCGAVACAMGWCPAVFPRFVAWNKYGDLVPAKTSTYQKFDGNGWNALEEYFGIKTEKQSDYLFQTNTYRYKERTKAKTVANRIREVVKNGFPKFKYDYPR